MSLERMRVETRCGSSSEALSRESSCRRGLFVVLSLGVAFLVSPSREVRGDDGDWCGADMCISEPPYYPFDPDKEDGNRRWVSPVFPGDPDDVPRPTFPNASPVWMVGEGYRYHLTLKAVPDQFILAAPESADIGIRHGLTFAASYRDAQIRAPFMTAIAAAKVQVPSVTDAAEPDVLPYGAKQGGSPDVVRPQLAEFDGEVAGTDPISLSDGELVLRRTDLALPGFGIPFRFDRTYRSRSDSDSSLGHGWDHSYNRRLKLKQIGDTADRSILYSAGDGRQLLFRWAGQSETVSDAGIEVTEILFEGPLGIHQRLRGYQERWTASAPPSVIQYSHHYWILSEPDGTAATFLAATAFGSDDSTVALLGRLEDSNGNGLQFHWELTPDNADQRLASVTDSVGRTILFSYRDDGFLERVLEPDSGLEASYSVDAFSGSLASVVSSNGAIEQYTYDHDPTRPPADYLPEPTLRDACAVACSPAGTFPLAQGVCDDAVETGRRECFARCQQCEPECSAQCGLNMEWYQKKCETACGKSCHRDTCNEENRQRLCERVFDELIAGECDQCVEYCAEHSKDGCYALAMCIGGTTDDGPDGPGTGTACLEQGEWAWDTLVAIANWVWDGAVCLFAWVPGVECGSNFVEDFYNFCHKYVTTCCAYGTNCGEGSVNAGRSCQSECRSGFLGGIYPWRCIELIADDCEAVCLPECRTRCVEESLSRCPQGCAEGCDILACARECQAVDYEGQCREGCFNGCLAKGREAGTGYPAGPKYGHPDDLNYNLLQVIDGNGTVVLQNIYGNDIKSPSFDSVIHQSFGGREVSLYYRDFVAEERGDVAIPKDGPALAYVTDRAHYESVEICPSACIAQSQTPADAEYVPWLNNLLVMEPSSERIGGLTATGTGVGPAFPPTVLRVSRLETGACVAQSVAAADKIPIVMSFSIDTGNGQASFAYQGNGQFAATGDAAALDYLVGLGELTVFVDRGLVFRAYPHRPLGMVHVTEGYCYRPFRTVPTDSGTIVFEPSNACSDSLLASPMATVVRDEGTLAAYSMLGPAALGTRDVFAGTVLAPGRWTMQWNQLPGVPGTYLPAIGPEDGAAPNSLVRAQLESVVAAPLLAPPSAQSIPLQPVVAYHLPAAARPQVVGSLEVVDIALPIWDSDIRFVASENIPECLYSLPGNPMSGIGPDAPGPKPERATVVIDPYGVPWTYYYKDGLAIRRINHQSYSNWAYNYDGAGNLLAVAEPLGGRVCNRYDWNGMLTKTVRLPAPDSLASGSGSTAVVQRFSYTAEPVRLEKAYDPRDPNRALVKYQWDAKGNLLSVTNGVGEKTTVVPNGWGLPEAVVAPDGSTTTYQYDGSASPSMIVVDAAGGSPLVLEVVHDSGGHPTSVVSPLGERRQLTWEGDRLVAITTEAGELASTEQRTYDDAARLVAVADEERGVEMTYDALGYGRTVTRRAIDGSLSSTTCLLHGPDGRVLESVQPEGQRIRYSYDSEGRQNAVVAGAWADDPAEWDDACPSLLAAEVPLQETALWQAEYDRAGKTTSTIDGRGLRTSLRYDGFGRLAMVTNSEDTSQRFGYDALGNVVWKAAYGAAGQAVPYRRPLLGDTGLEAAVEYEYDAAGRLVKEDQWHFVAVTGQPVGDGHVTTSYSYSPGGRTVTVTDDLGRATIFEADGAGRRTAVVLPTGDSFTTSYLDGGQTILTSQPAPTPSGVLSQVMRLTVWGAPDTLETEDGLVLRDWEYDSHKRMRSIVEASGMVTELVPDAFGRAATQRTVFAEGVEETIRRAWDHNGWLTAIASDAGVGTGERSFVYDYDLLGRVERVVDPLGNEETYAYEGATGLVATRIDARGVEYRNTWSPAGLLSRIMAMPPVDADLGEIQFRSFTYDALGRVVSALDSGESYPYTTDDINTYLGWDSLGNKTGEWDTNLGVNYAITHQYDGVRETPIASKLGPLQVGRSFDALGRLTDVRLAGETNPAVHFDYLGLGSHRLIGVGDSAGPRHTERVQTGQAVVLRHHSSTRINLEDGSCF
ncbi:MAG: DUF6531 domain-containing protein, partial [Pseudomonadota bacterium]